MPNWCDNELEVKGKIINLERFKDKAKGENGCLDMNSFIPYPEAFRKQDIIAKEHNERLAKEIEDLNEEEREEYCKTHKRMKDGYNSGGYEWCCDNWGTKWNFYEPTLSYENEKMLHYDFATAWAPPIPVIIRMSEIFPKLKFELRCFESGEGFRGHVVVKKGEVVKRCVWKYRGHRGG